MQLLWRFWVCIWWYRLLLLMEFIKAVVFPCHNQIASYYLRCLLSPVRQIRAACLGQTHIFEQVAA